MVDNRIAKSAAKAAIREYDSIRNEPQVNQESEKQKVVNSEKSDDAPSDGTAGADMETNPSELSQNINDELDRGEGGEEKLEAKMFGAEKSESSVDETKDVPTCSRAEETDVKSEEKELSDGESIQVTLLQSNRILPNYPGKSI